MDAMVCRAQNYGMVVQCYSNMSIEDDANNCPVSYGGRVVCGGAMIFL